MHNNSKESERHSPRAITDGDTILATVEIDAPTERVFRALTSDEVEKWWGSADTYRVVNWRADLRVGGQWSLGVRLPNDEIFPAGGEFIEIEIEDPKKIVLTRRYDWDHPTMGRRITTVTYRIDQIADGARVTVRHDGFGGLSEAADEHAGGWERFLGWLAAYLEPDKTSAMSQSDALKL